jgi:hypothetical protein
LHISRCNCFGYHPDNVDEEHFENTSNELKYHLETHNLAFEKWRYLYEVQNADMYFYTFSFGKADEFLKSLAPIIAEKYDKVKNKYFQK